MLKKDRDAIVAAVLEALGGEAPSASRKAGKATRKTTAFYDAVIASRVPCAMGKGGKPVPGCSRRFAANGDGNTTHLRHGKK